MPVSAAVTPAHLAATDLLDHERDEVRSIVADVTRGASDRRDEAVRLFERVRDGIRYDPYVALAGRDTYRASFIAGQRNTFCTPKAILLTALWRAAGFPARLGFADVRNHLNSAKLRARMASDVFVWHGYSEVYLDDRWQKVSSAFNVELCHRFGVKVLDWTGEGDSLMHPYDVAGNQHMEYVRSHGSFDDVPYDELMIAYNKGALRNWGTDEVDEAFAP